ncbi:hypothetical protein DSO57_1019796 [Entomophthora muscae]|uniref:Uncharacterized protein n=1 Tax=Entomophthora muscae TaxID=34485 RepID=A0ACC2UQD2_9FUNG|nr:hypothetical protein DSO57_1019796 [Entomophthora muscae]
MNSIAAIKSKKELPSSKFLENITVTTTDGDSVKLSSLWKHQDVVLKVLPRLGCRLCKYEAQSLGELRMLTDPSAVALAAVCFTGPDLQTFLSNGYWAWEIFLDDAREVYRKAELHRFTRWEAVKNYLSKYFKAMSSYVDHEFAFPNNFRGDRLQLGGTFIIRKGGEMLYQFKPTKLAMYPSIKEMYSCLGGNPDDIEEPTPAEFVFTQEESRAVGNTVKKSNSGLFHRTSTAPQAY